MLFDKSLMFYDKIKTAPSDAAVIQTNGSDYSRMFIASTIGENVTGLKLTVKCSEDGITYTEIASKTASADDIKRGVVALPTPLNLGKFTQVIPTITVASSKTAGAMSCGIVDAVDNSIYYK